MIKTYTIFALFVLLLCHGPQSMAAKTAKDVKCNGCVGTKDLAKNAVTNAKIKKGAVSKSKLSSDVQDILDTVDSNETRITALESGIPVPQFSGYGTPLTPLGNPVNAVVLRRDNGDGSIDYYVRAYYENDSEEISVQGAMITPPLIFLYGYVSVDSDGEITRINQYIEAPQTTDFVDFTAEDRELDPDNPTNTLVLNSDDIRELWTCTGGGAVSNCEFERFVDGVSDSTSSFVAVYSALGPGTVNGMEFDSLRGENRTYSAGHIYRVRARGVGMVLQLDSGRPRTAIYYQVDGVTDGSLAGTPFGSGKPLDGLWF